MGQIAAWQETIIERRLVNGCSHGLDQFAEAYRIGDEILSGLYT